MDNRTFSEVVESSLNSWTAHCWAWDRFPNAGTLVVIDQEQIRLFGIIRLIETGSIDPNRIPFAYQKTEEELRRDHPQIFSFLKTTCTCMPTGFCEKDGPVMYHQSPRPPKIHAFVRPATREEQALFFSQTDYQDLLVCRLQKEDFDELLLAMVREHQEYFTAKNPNFLAFFENYAHLINHDYARLRRFTARVETLIKTTTILTEL